MEFTIKIVSYNDKIAVQVKHDGEIHVFDSKKVDKALALTTFYMLEKWRQENGL